VADVINWRNNAGSGNLALAVNASNQLTFNGVVLESDTLPSAEIFVGNASNESTARALTGDISINNTGVSAIASGVIIDADVNASAAIALTKLAATTVSRGLVSDASGFIVPATTTATEIGYVNGVTSSIQNQLGTKKTIATGNAYRFETTNVSGDLQETAVTASRAVATDANGLPTASATTSTELSYVSGVSSAIQTQLTGKASLALDNLASVAINTTLLPATDNAIDLGSASKEFRSAYLKTSLIIQQPSGGTNTITLAAPTSLTSYTLTLPISAGISPYVLTTNGSGTTSWDSPAVIAINEQVVSYTLVLTDLGKLIDMNTAASATFTIPPNSSVAFPVGSIVAFRQKGNGDVTITPGVGVTVNATGLVTVEQFSAGAVIKMATDTWTVLGDTI